MILFISNRLNTLRLFRPDADLLISMIRVLDYVRLKCVTVAQGLETSIIDVHVHFHCKKWFRISCFFLRIGLTLVINLNRCQYNRIESDYHDVPYPGIQSVCKVFQFFVYWCKFFMGRGWYRINYLLFSRQLKSGNFNFSRKRNNFDFWFFKKYQIWIFLGFNIKNFEFLGKMKLIIFHFSH